MNLKHAAIILCMALCASGLCADEKNLNVAAASNLQYALADLNKAFEEANPGIKLKTVFGSSGSLSGQILNKAPFDVFVSADMDYPQKLLDAGVAIKDSMAVYAVGRLVLWIPSGSPIDFERGGMKSLLEPFVKRIAIANPKLAPYGRAAEEALKSAGIYGQVKGRLLFGENITQTAQYVQSGAADAGFIAESLTYGASMKGKGIAWRIHPKSYPKIRQALLVIKDSEAAREYCGFILGAKGRGILNSYGFGDPKGGDEP